MRNQTRAFTCLDAFCHPEGIILLGILLQSKESLFFVEWDCGVTFCVISIDRQEIAFLAVGGLGKMGYDLGANSFIP